MEQQGQENTRLGLRAAARRLTELGYAISHVGLLKAHADGRVPRGADGNFDIAICLEALRQNSHPTRSRIARLQQVPKPGTDHAKLTAKKVDAVSLDDTPAGLLIDETTPGIPTDGQVDPLPVGGSIAEATRRLEWLRVQREETRVAREQGRLVEIAPVNAYVAGMIIRARDEFLRLPTELRDLLAHETDPIKIDRLLTARIEDALGKMAEYRGGTELRVAA